MRNAWGFGFYQSIKNYNEVIEMQTDNIYKFTTLPF